jgi:hypothetical protein
MAELKTRPSEESVDAFLDRIEDAQRREDCRTLVRLMRRVSRVDPKMWGSSMVGFGEYHYKYASGHEGDAFLTGFAPRKSDLTLYLMPGFEGKEALLAKLGKHKTGKACLYLKRLADVDMGVLEQLVSTSVEELRRRYPPAHDGAR